MIYNTTYFSSYSSRIYLRNVLHSNLLVLAGLQLLNKGLHTWFLHRATAHMQCSREQEACSIHQRANCKLNVTLQFYRSLFLFLWLHYNYEDHQHLAQAELSQKGFPKTFLTTVYGHIRLRYKATVATDT